MKWIFAMLIFIGIFSYPVMYLLMWLFAILETIVHKMDKKELTQKQLEKGMWIISVIISVAMGILLVYLKS